MSTYAIIGAAGKVGFATSSALREAGVPVRAILRNESKAERLRSIGCDIAIADLHDVGALSKAMDHVDAVQVIVPLIPSAADPVEEMRKTMDCVARAIEQARPKRVLAISDYGAHVDRDIGMPSLFRAFEERLRGLDGEKVILRSAEHVENWARVIGPAAASGILPTFHNPVDRPLPTISAPDLGAVAAQLLLSPNHGENVRVFHAEGPRRYSDNEVAAALSEILDKTVQAQAIPRSQWDDVFGQSMPRSLGDLLIRTNDAQNEGGLIEVEAGSADIRYGNVELTDALRNIVSQLAI